MTENHRLFVKITTFVHIENTQNSAKCHNENYNERITDPKSSYDTDRLTYPSDMHSPCLSTLMQKAFKISTCSEA